MNNCKICKEKIKKIWKYCPKCGTKTKKYSVFPVAKISYMWEKEDRGGYIFKNFRAIKESGVFPFKKLKVIRPTLGDFCHINCYNLRKFSLLAYNPNLIYELYEACKLMGYYDVENVMKESGLQKFIESLSRTDHFWDIFEDKKFIKVAKESFSRIGVGIVDWTMDRKRGKFTHVIRESLSTPLKSSCSCCPEQLADFIGSLEYLSQRFWGGRESKCISKGDEYCQLDIHIIKTEEKPNIEVLDKTEVHNILNNIVCNLKEGDVLYRRTIGDYVHISGEQCINYVLISKSPGHEIVAKYSGNIVGKKMAQEMPLKTEKESFEYLTNIFKHLKVGILTSLQQTDDTIKIQMQESLYSSGVDNINTKLDTFIAGIIEGVLKEATNQKWNVEETKCLANGDDYCEFVCKSG
jgi:predicted hydrocarbon binding protein